MRDIDADGHKRRLVALICRFAGATGAQVIAEGVETRAEAVAVEACGADMLQGYFFGRPQLAIDAAGVPGQARVA